LVKTTLAGIRRTLGTRVRQAAALTMDDLRRISFPDTTQGKRDRALLMTAVSGGFRRSEISSLQVEDIRDSEQGVRVLLRRSKGDQEAAGAWVDVVRAVSPRHCPVAALREWLAVMGRGSGPLFPSLRRWGRITNKSLSPEGINLLVKWAALQCGLDPAEFSGHSPRAGCATYLLDRGISLNVVANHLRHKSINTTRRYDRNATAKALTGVY
jgi:integrase